MHGLPVLPGLINNVLYVIILSSALDLVGPSVPKGVVLLADVLPSFLTKLCAPYFIHTIPYPFRILAFVALSTCGMLLIALTPALQDARSISIKMAGVILASLSSGGGELSFLGLTHYYGHFALAAWGSGTGGAGLVGAGAYVVATTVMGLSVRNSLLIFSCLPVIMLISFFIVLPLGPIRPASKYAEYQRIEQEERLPSDQERRSPLDPEGLEIAREVDQPEEGERFLSSSSYSQSGRASSPMAGTSIIGTWRSFKANLRRSRSLFFP